MNNSKEVLYARNVDDNLQSIIDTYKKTYKYKSEAKVIRRIINDFPRVIEFMDKYKAELEIIKQELNTLKEEKRKIFEIYKI